MNRLIERLVYQGQPIPWEELDGPEAERVDQELAVVAGEMIDAGQLIRTQLCLAERRRYTDLGLRAPLFPRDAIERGEEK